jgi:hypothetical protein
MALLAILSLSLILIPRAEIVALFETLFYQAKVPARLVILWIYALAFCREERLRQLQRIVRPKPKKANCVAEEHGADVNWNAEI